MDTSEEYRRMCNCLEIQGRQRYLRDDHIACAPDPFSDRTVWLPRQDQLTEMLKDTTWQMIYRENDYVACLLPEKKNETIYCYASTAEQVLLELVILSLHQKKWNGEEWEK